MLTLQLDHSRVEAIHEATFNYTRQLQKLNLSKNKPNVVSYAVSLLRVLRSLDPSDNLITGTIDASYQGLKSAQVDE